MSKKSPKVTFRTNPRYGLYGLVPISTTYLIAFQEEVVVDVLLLENVEAQATDYN